MDCERCAEDLTAYLDGELSDAKKLEVKSHLETCRSCREEYRSLELSARFVETHTHELQLNPEVWNRVRASTSVMEAPAPSPGIFYWLLSNPWSGAAVTAAATAALALGLWGYMRHQVAQRDLIQYMTQYIQTREAQEKAPQAPALSSESASTEANPVHSEYKDNPFVTVQFDPDTNPFRSEDQ